MKTTTVVDKVLQRIKKKKAGQKSPEEKEREAQVWEVENWLVGTGNTVSSKRRRGRYQHKP